MKRILNSTAAISVALMNVQPWPLMAQTLTDVGSVIAADGTVLCEPTADLACDPLNPELIVQALKIQADMEAAAAAVVDAQAKADAEAAAAAAADAQAKADEAAAAAADAQAKADAEAAVAAAAAAQAKADADAAAADAADAQAKADADAAAADAQAKADAEAAVAAAAQATADAEAAAAAAAQATADADATAAAEADAKAKADAEAAATVEADAQAKADADAAAAADAQAKADADAAAAADAQAKADAEAAAEADAKAKADAEPAAVEPVAEVPAPAVEDAAANEAARAAAEAELAVKADGTIVDPAAGLKSAVEVIDPAAVPVEVPVVSEEEIQSLTDLLTGGAAAAVDGAVAATAIAAAEAGPKAVDAAPSAEAVTATSEVITEDQTRRATEEFAAAPAVVAPGKKNKLSNLEKAGLLGLGALVVGAIISQNRNANSSGVSQSQQQVVSNTGDRVVVLRPDGDYQVYKDDDALLRRPGNTLRTETYRDGSTQTIVDRADGTQIVTIRDATGRVLRRAHYDTNGNERLLFNDLEPERPIVVSTLPVPRSRPVVISGRDGDAALKAALAQRQIEKIGRTFSLRQVRTIPQVRYLAAMVDVNPITFASGSSALSRTEVDALSDLGAVMQDLLDANPNEIFLIEGHTDATGKAAMNLALSDRRAETVALALTEYFDIPPENMVVQGYGESELLIDTQADEKRNRRVGVRIITPLL